MNQLISFWKFTRPHTIIGSAVSVTVLFVLAGGILLSGDWYFWITLAAALLCNIFITGYNQVVDASLDAVNKPWLPIPAGEINLDRAKIISWGSLALSIALALYISPGLAILIGSIAALGFVYSWKGVYLKRHHTTAAAAILIVRGLLINLGFYMHFSFEAFDAIPADIWVLTLFTSLYSLGIAWFKDIPDLKGDAGEGISTLAVKTGSIRAFQAGMYAVALAYVAGAFAPIFYDFQLVNGPVLVVGHALFGLTFLSISARVKPDEGASIRRFYKIFWLFFFIEYLLFAVANYI